MFVNIITLISTEAYTVYYIEFICYFIFGTAVPHMIQSDVLVAKRM
jgi:hypothetical protein